MDVDAISEFAELLFQLEESAREERTRLSTDPSDRGSVSPLGLLLGDAGPRHPSPGCHKLRGIISPAEAESFLRGFYGENIYYFASRRGEAELGEHLPLWSGHGGSAELMALGMRFAERLRAVPDGESGDGRPLWAC